MLIEYNTDGKKYNFIDSQYKKNGSNKFTVIVGKNGTGKSRMLRSVINFLLEKRIDANKFERDLLYRDKKKLDCHLLYGIEPKKIIAVSTSPFDRFPILRGREHNKVYAYLGLRGLHSHNLGLAYMSKIINSLIEAIIYDSNRAIIVTDVLGYLGYSGTVEARFHLYPSVKRMTEILSSSSPKNALADYLDRPQAGVFMGHSNNIQLEATDENIKRALSVFERVIVNSRKPRFDVEISKNGIRLTDSTYDINEDFLFLAQAGFAKLRDVTFKKKGVDERLRINDASSGEQSVVMSLLGIASQIEDGSLICIDEPEVCLHPEWQEKYIELLTSTFNMYKDCQFIIATHSPQIVANLDANHCYVMPMDSGIAIPAEEFVDKSADFQLAKLFKSPGFKNEYLSRIALNLFVKVSKRKLFDETDILNFSILNDNFELIELHDPVYGLVVAIKEMYAAYGKD